MFLASTSDIIRIVTATGVSTIGVEAAWVDYSAGTITPGRTNTAITTGTTTTVVGSPAASTVRNVKRLSITNNHASSSCVVTVQHYDGTTSIDIEKITLDEGESLIMAEDGEWRHLTAYGAEYEYLGGPMPNLGITGTLAETNPREACAEANSSPLSSGTLFLVAVYLKAGTLVSNISVHSGTTAAGTPTNQFFALYGRKLNLLAQSANDTTTAWAANTMKTLAMTTPYRVPVSDTYFIGIMVTATTVPTIKCLSQSAGQLSQQYPPNRGTGTTGLTTVLPDPSAALSSSNFVPWAAIT